MYRTTTFIAFVVLSALPLGRAVAQNRGNEGFRELLNQVLEEKLRLPVDSEPMDADEAPRAFAVPKTATRYDAVLSSDATAESEVHAAMNPRDTANIIVSPIRYQGAGFTLPIYYTRDFGATWAKSDFKAVPGPGANVVGGGDPMFAFGSDGRAYFSWISLYSNAVGDSTMWGMFWAYSDDGGQTWQRAKNDRIAFAGASGGLPYGLFGLPALYDKQWMIVDRTSSSYSNTLYTAFVQLSLSQETSTIVVARKPGSAAEFLEPVAISDAAFTAVQFSSLDIDPDGGIHVTFFGSKDKATYALWHSVSTNGGATFSTPVKISNLHIMRFSADEAADSIIGVPHDRLYPCPHIVIDRSDSATRGNLYAVWTADGTTARGDDGLDIYFSRSVDNGTTWSDPIVVNDDPRGKVRHQYYPSIAVNDRGAIVVTWYDRRNDPLQRNTDYRIALSTDGGATFSSSLPVTSALTDFSTVGKKNGNFGVGEYNQVLLTSNYAVPIWTDGRGNDGNLDIYAAFVPLEVIPLGEGTSGVERVSVVDGSLTIHGLAVDGETARLEFELRSRASVRVDVVDMAGRVVVSRSERSYEAGSHAIDLDLGALPSGRYVCRVVSDHGVAVTTFPVVR